MADDRYDDLVRDLAALGRTVDPPASADRLATAVMDRVAGLPTPVPRTRRARVGRILESRRRRIAVVVAVVVLAVLAAPPVRAAIADWFGFGGVRVEQGPPDSGTRSGPLEVSGDASVAEAQDAVDFPVLVPAELGRPDGVQVSADRRIVSMSWSEGADGVVRLDQFDGRLDFTMAKQSPDVRYAAVGGSDALWFDEPHEVVLIEPDGTRRTESARLAGHTLIWIDGTTTLRLEGDLTLDRAVEIAESAGPVPVG